MSRVGGYETGMMKVSLNTGAIYKKLRTCQWLIAVYCCVMMVSSVAGVSLVEKCAYIGQAAKSLYNIDSDYADPSLYSENGIFLASWKGTTNTVADMAPHYIGKIYMDRERNIWMFDVERKDAGRYYVKFGADRERLEVDIILTVKEECPDVPKEGTSHDTTTAGSKKDYTEASVMPEQILQLLCNYSQKVMMEPYGSSNSLMIGLLSAILVILSLDIVLRNIFSETYIRDGWITGQHWIQKKQSSQSHAYTSVMVTIDGSELTEHQVRNWLEGHPEFFENNESLTEFLVKGFLELHPDFMKKNDKTKANLPKLSATIKGIPPRTDFNDVYPSTSRDVQNSNQASQSTARNLEGHDSDSNDEQDLFLRDPVDQNGKLHQTVLNRCLQKLMMDLRVSDVMEHIQQKGIFDNVTICDINDQTTGKQKILHLLYQIKQRDQHTYEMFKECLSQSNHEHLKQMLEEEEEKLLQK